jgi:hypothetical protein
LSRKHRVFYARYALNVYVYPVNKPSQPESNWQQKTLENLEKDFWGAPTFNSHLVTRCHELRKIPLEEFTTGDLRIMIGQQIGLPHLIPLAIEVLTVDLFVQGDYYPGDLLQFVLQVNPDFWRQNKAYWLQVNGLIQNRRQEIADLKLSTEKFDSMAV